MNNGNGRLAALAGLLLLLAGESRAQQVDSSWSLNGCIEQAFRSSSSLEASHWTQQSARAEHAESKSALLPSLTANGSYNYTSETLRLDIAAPPVPGYTAPQIDFGDGNVYDLNVNARVPIYAGGALRYRAGAAEAAARAAAFDYRADSLALLRDVRRAYFEVMSAEAALKAAHNRIERLRRHAEEVEGARRIGTATEEARLSALASLRAAEGDALRQTALAAAARLRLGRLVGLPDTEVRTLEDLDSSLIAGDDAGESDRPELSALDQRMLQSERAAKSAKGNFLPSLSGAVAYHYARPGVNQVANEWMDYYTVGLAASWTLWDFGARSHRVNVLRLSGNAIRSTRENTDRFFRMQLAAAEVSRASALPAAEKMRERLRLQQERLLLVEKRYQAGLASESEYLDAQDDFTEAETQWISAVTALRMAEADLLYAQGR